MPLACGGKVMNERRKSSHNIKKLLIGAFTVIFAAVFLSAAWGQAVGVTFASRDIAPMYANADVVVGNFLDLQGAVAAAPTNGAPHIIVVSEDITLAAPITIGGGVFGGNFTVQDSARMELNITDARLTK